MCSNTSSSGGGGDYASLILKKPKRQKVPKRGPGVAELEKILREQENTNSEDRDKIEGFSSCRISPFSNSYNNHPQASVMSSSNSFTRHVPNFSPPAPHVTLLYANGGKSTVLGGGGNGGSSMVLPEQGLFPTMWSSCCESSICGESPKYSTGYPFPANGSDHMHHFPVMLQKKPCQHSSPSTINLFRHSGGSLSSSDNPSAGFYLHLEPPSNQISHQNYTSVSPEEGKIVSMKRPRTFTVDNTLDPPFQFQVSPHFPQSPSHDNHTAFNLKQNETVSRDHAKPGGHFLLFGSAGTPPHTQTSQQEFSKHNSTPFQHCDGKEMSGRSNQVSSGQGGKVEKKPFFSFLIPEEQNGEAETALTLNNERSRMRGEAAIDLNLKL